MLSKDDPFASIFMNPDDIKKQIALKLAGCFRQKNEERAAKLRNAEAERLKKVEKSQNDGSKEDLTKVDSQSSGPIL